MNLCSNQSDNNKLNHRLSVFSLMYGTPNKHIDKAKEVLIADKSNIKYPIIIYIKIE